MDKFRRVFSHMLIIHKIVIKIRTLTFPPPSSAPLLLGEALLYINYHTKILTAKLTVSKDSPNRTTQTVDKIKYLCR